MKDSGLKNEQQVGRILVSGSQALHRKNIAGVHLFQESDLTDGIIYGKLVKPNYNIDELTKAVDTTIFELLPQRPVIPFDGVARPVYNDATQSVINLTFEVKDLTRVVSDLRSKVSSLEIVTQSLRVEVDGEKLKAGISENQSTVANSQIATTTIDLQNAIVNSLNEAIQRVSLEARVEALQEAFKIERQFKEQAQKASLLDFVNGLENQYQISEKIGYKVIDGPKTDIFNEGWQIYYDDRKKDDRGFLLGPTVEFYNIGEMDAVLTYSSQNLQGTADGNAFTFPSTITIPKSNDGGSTPGKFSIKLTRKDNFGKGTHEAKITYKDKNSTGQLLLRTHYWQARSRRDT
tara:strand:+ start:1646 stop:2689 length:1044 start_codon:yes stop_codon:yes gene_type:complete